MDGATQSSVLRGERGSDQGVGGEGSGGDGEEQGRDDPL